LIPIFPQVGDAFKCGASSKAGIPCRKFHLVAFDWWETVNFIEGGADTKNSLQSVWMWRRINSLFFEKKVESGKELHKYNSGKEERLV
jgi:hypothetical protein